MSESFVAEGGHYDLCLVGAGYAGLNAAFVASQYLPSTARVLVLDKHQGPGGMWNDTYSYVRLHQPYRQFTAGNISWTLGRERSYLATRDEVAAHLRHCFDTISKRFEVDARWGWECLGHTEDGGSVVVTARGPDGEDRTFTADRLIDATSFDIESNDPFPLTCGAVRSVAPQDLGDTGLMGDEHNDPVWVIGSGKTAMDTIVALVRANPARRVGMVTGTGTYFYNRDLVNPTGVKRWIGGVRYNAIFAGAAERFDGTNAAEVTDWCRAKVGTSPLVDPAPTHLFFALLSAGESATVASGVSEVIRDHFVDVVDDPSGPVMVLRTGARQSISSGSWVVNCTGLTGLVAGRTRDYVPYVSPSGKTMSINLTSTTLPSPGACSYVMTHLFFLDKLVDAPLYELDFYGLLRDAPDAALAVSSCLIRYNLSVALDHLPMKAFRDFGLDIDRWYPLPRQIAGQVQMMRNRKRDRAHNRQALDTFSATAHVRCGRPASAASSAR